MLCNLLLNARVFIIISRKMLSEEEIIQGCIRNDRAMQKELYQRYSGRMFAICLRYARSRDEGQDMLQEGFMKIYKKISQFSREHSFEGWMKRVFVNTAITHYRNNLKYYYQEEINEVHENAGIHHNVDDYEYSKEEMMDVIAKLPDGYRVVFCAFAIEGFKHKEIGEMLGIDESTSKSQYHRARKMIQQKLYEISSCKVTHV